MSTALTIASTAIRQDEHGRFCLNDLHVASGGAERHGPKYWLKNKQTSELRDEFPNGGIPPVEATRGRYGGTYAVRELVYAYAMRVSPKFHLAVIRAYDHMVTQGRMQPPPLPLPRPSCLAWRFSSSPWTVSRSALRRRQSWPWRHQTSRPHIAYCHRK